MYFCAPVCQLGEERALDYCCEAAVGLLLHCYMYCCCFCRLLPLRLCRHGALLPRAFDVRTAAASLHGQSKTVARWTSSRTIQLSYVQVYMYIVLCCIKPQLAAQLLAIQCHQQRAAYCIMSQRQPIQCTLIEWAFILGDVGITVSLYIYMYIFRSRLVCCWPVAIALLQLFTVAKRCYT